MRDPLRRATIAKGFLLFVGTLVAAALVVWLCGALDERAGSHVLFVSDRNFAQLAGFLSNSSDIFPSLIGIIITMIAILLELSAARYSSRVIDYFLRDKVILFSLAFFVLAALDNILINLNVRQVLGTGGAAPSGGVPFGKVSVLVALLQVAVVIALLIPFFSYIVRFFKAENILGIFRGEVEAGLALAAAGGGRGAPHRLKNEIIDSTNILHDIVLKAILESNRPLAAYGVRAIEETLRAYARGKDGMPAWWWIPSHEAEAGYENVAYDDLVIDGAGGEARAAAALQRRDWYERHVYRHLELLLGKCLRSLYDVAGEIARLARDLGMDAVAQGDDARVETAARMLNSMLRLAVNEGDKKTVSALFFQYFLFAEAALVHRDAWAPRLLEHLVYYANLAHALRLDYVIDAVAYDTRRLLRFAVRVGSAEAEKLLAVYERFGLVDNAGVPVAAVPNLEKSKLVLAAQLYALGYADLADAVADRVRRDDPVLLAAALAQVERAEEEEYFEFTERRCNFSWLDPAERAGLAPLKRRLGL